MPSRSIEFESERQFHKLYCENPEHLLSIEKSLGIKVIARGSLLQLEGDKVPLDRAEEFFTLLQVAKEQGLVHGKYDLFRFLHQFQEKDSKDLKALLDRPLRIQIRKKSVVPRNLSQRKFLDLILKNDLVFGIGPAGTGKTFLAMIVALHALLEGEVERIVLARPAVEAGEALGFLPGDLEEKLLPYLRLRLLRLLT
jgi:phosphate starvation-inducible PhoH-like protein